MQNASFIIPVSVSSPLPAGATLVGAEPPYTEGQTATLECEEGKLSAKGESSTIVTFTHGEWIMQDPDFDCFESEKCTLFIFKMTCNLNNA